MEHRCCIEFLNIKGKLVFDGSIENLDCIIRHEEYKAITNKAVLENARIDRTDADLESHTTTELVRDFQFAGVRKKKSKHHELV